MKIDITSRSRIFPNCKVVPSVKDLSILDSACLTLAPTAAIWVYDNLEQEVDLLISSFKSTLNQFPHFAGQVKFSPTANNARRQGRVCVSYGFDDDPGVELVVAHSPDIFTPHSFEGSSLLPDAPHLALHDAENYLGLPGMIIQFTGFAGGGLAVAIKLVHCLGDAQTLLCFMHRWAESHCQNGNCTAVSALPPPIFDPSIIDKSAAGDSDAALPDLQLVRYARNLPQHRYDWWTSSQDCPSVMARETQPPPFFGNPEPSGDPMPWAEWNLSTPVSSHDLHFSKDEVNGIWRKASASTAFSAVDISRLDALIAHVWFLIMRARELNIDEVNHANISIGVRQRLFPTLPQEHLGSPITLARVSCNPSQSTVQIAAQIRSTISQFNSSTIPALLHDMMFDATPQRIWRAFLGRKNLIITSWLHLGMYQVKLGAQQPTLATAIIPCMDGCIQIMEPPPTSKDTDTSERKWYEDGVNVSLNLVSQVLDRLLQDPLLRP